MATEVIKVVDPDQGSGYDYASLNAWEAGQQGDLPTLDEIHTAKCRSASGGADTAQCNLNGWTTDATRYIKIWTDPNESYRHDGKWNTSKYRLDVSDVAFYIVEGNVRIIGIQFTSTSIYALREAASSDVVDLRISQCILKGQAGNTTAGLYIVDGASGSKVRLWNNVIYDVASGAYGIHIERAGMTAYVYNNTLVDNGGGINAAYGTVVAKNNIVKGSGDTNAYAGTFASGTDYNSTDGTDSPGTGSNNKSSQSFTFVDETNDDFHLASTDTGAKNSGTDLSSDANLAFSDDIDGETRSGTWDIGADEYISAGPAPRSFSIIIGALPFLIVGAALNRDKTMTRKDFLRLDWL